MAQSRRHSLAETISSTVVGYFLAIITQVIVYPMFEIEVKIHENMLIALIFTAVSIVRGYVFRRLWNAFEIRNILKGK